MPLRPTLSSLTATTILAVAVVLPSPWLDRLAACPFKSLTGLSCPGCGLTHAFVAVGHLEFASAWRANPAVFAILPLVVWFALEPWWRKHLTPPANARVLRWAAWIAAGAFIGTWGWRIACETVHTCGDFSLPR